MSGTAWGIGLGPGDPELLTLKAARLLRQVPVIAYPAPLNGPSLARAIAAPHLPGGQAEIVLAMPMIADRFPAQDVYRKGAAEIGALLEAGQDVAILCEGDPLFYGSFLYLFGLLSGCHRVEVVPGVSSLTACAAAAGMPLAGRNDVLTVLPAPLPAEELCRRLETCESAAIIKLGRHFGKVRAVLAALGLTDHARYVAHASRPDQQVLTVDAVNVAEVPYFSMLLVCRSGGLQTPITGSQRPFGLMPGGVGGQRPLTYDAGEQKV